MEPLRPTDAPGALLPVPTPEVLPGGSPATPWTPRAGGEPMAIEYAAGEAWVVADGEGEVGVRVDGEPRDPRS